MYNGIYVGFAWRKTVVRSKNEYKVLVVILAGVLAPLLGTFLSLLLAALLLNADLQRILREDFRQSQRDVMRPMMSTSQFCFLLAVRLLEIAFLGVLLTLADQRLGVTGLLDVDTSYIWFGVSMFFCFGLILALVGSVYKQNSQP